MVHLEQKTASIAMCSKCGACVMAIKFHENWVKSRPLVEQLMAYPGTAVVVVERHDLDAQYCSLQYSMATGIWHGGNHEQQDKWTKAHCHPGTFKAFEFKKSVTQYFLGALNLANAEEDIPQHVIRGIHT